MLFQIPVDTDRFPPEHGSPPRDLCRDLSFRHTARQVRLPSPRSLTTSPSHTTPRSDRDTEHSRPGAPSTRLQHVEHDHAILTSTGNRHPPAGPTRRSKGTDMQVIEQHNAQTRHSGTKCNRLLARATQTWRQLRKPSSTRDLH
jgi:hypothetical protein